MPAVNLRFDAILFQQEAIRRLIAPWKQGKIDQTYIFAGQTSVGKRRTALAFAALLQCLEPPIGGDGLPEACGNCLSCRRIIGGTHPDVNFILPQGAEIRIDQVRQMQEMALLKPFLGKWRIFILDPAERLNEYSSNSLLKILEESPPRVLFILVTANLYRLLPTILSRATLVRFRTPTHEEARGVLQELSGRAAEEIAAWYGVSGGRFGLTLEWLSTGASLADFPALDLPGAQVAFLRALKGIPGRLEPPLQEAGSLEQALKVFSEADVASWPELCHARRVRPGAVAGPGPAGGVSAPVHRPVVGGPRRTQDGPQERGRRVDPRPEGELPDQHPEGGRGGVFPCHQRNRCRAAARLPGSPGRLDGRCPAPSV